MKLYVTSYKENFIDEDIKNYRNYKYHFRNNDIKLALAFDRKDLAENSFAKIVDQVESTIKHGVGPKNIVITFYNNFNKKVFSKEEIERMKQLRESFKKMGVDVRVYDYKDAYTIEDVESSSKKIKEIVNDIKLHKLSPLEELLSAYLMVSDREYITEGEGESPSKSRSIFSIINNKEIVCAGYSTYLKTLADELENPNIKVFCNMVSARDTDYSYGFHQNNIVYLKDEKYHIDGFFYLDPTKDSDKIKNLEDIKLNFFMIPINEIKSLKDNIVDYRVTLDQYMEDLEEFDEEEEYEEDEEVQHEQSVYSRSDRRVRDKIPNTTNLPLAMYSSLSNSTFRMEILKKNSNFSEESFYQYLISRTDFNNFAINSFLRVTNPNKTYKVADRKKAYWYSRRYPDKFYGKIGIRKMWNFMKRHTHYVDKSQILEALRQVLKANFPYSSKDEITKVVNSISQANVEKSKEYFTDQSLAPFPIVNYNLNALNDKSSNSTMEK